MYGADSTQFEENRAQIALTMAYINDWVDALPEGLETSLADGAESLLSGGQRQRLLLAHLFYTSTDPELVFLDDAFSALNPSLRITVKNSMSYFFKKHADRTGIIISRHYEVLQICSRVLNTNGSTGQLECKPLDGTVAPVRTRICK